MHILISGALTSNGGDASIMDAQLKELGRVFEEPSFTILDSRPSVARKLFPQADVRHPLIPYRWRRSAHGLGDALFEVYRTRMLRAARRRRSGKPQRGLLPLERAHLDTLSGADLVVYTGGTSLIEQYAPKWKLVELEIALAAGVPVVLMPQSIGRMRSHRNRARLREVLRDAKLVLLRDARSETHVEELGVDSSGVHVVPDIVFSVQRPSAAARLRETDVPSVAPSVAISVRDVATFHPDGAQGQVQYERAVADLVGHLVQSLGARITFISTCQGLEGYAYDDSVVARRVVDLLDTSISDGVIVDSAYHTPDELHARLKEFDFAVVTRLHAGITALNVGTPVVPIAYEFKTREVMTQLGIGEFVTDLVDVTSDVLISSTERFLIRLPELRGTLADRLTQARHEISEAVDELAAAL